MTRRPDYIQPRKAIPAALDEIERLQELVDRLREGQGGGQALCTKGSEMSDTLADALPREIARVTAKKERWLGYMREHPGMAHGMSISVKIMTAEIERAVRALASGDVAKMLEAHEALKGYNDDD